MCFSLKKHWFIHNIIHLIPIALDWEYNVCFVYSSIYSANYQDISDDLLQWYYVRGVYFAPHLGGNYFFHLPPRVPRNGGQKNICPPGSRKMGGKKSVLRAPKNEGQKTGKQSKKCVYTSGRLTTMCFLWARRRRKFFAFTSKIDGMKHVFP